MVSAKRKCGLEKRRVHSVVHQNSWLQKWVPTRVYLIRVVANNVILLRFSSNNVTLAQSTGGHSVFSPTRCCSVNRRSAVMTRMKSLTPSWKMSRFTQCRCLVTPWRSCNE